MEYQDQWEDILKNVQARHPDVHKKTGDFAHHVIFFYSQEKKSWKLEYRDEKTIPMRIRKEIYKEVRQLLGF